MLELEENKHKLISLKDKLISIGEALDIEKLETEAIELEKQTTVERLLGR